MDLMYKKQQIARADIVFSDCINQLEKLLNYGEMTALKSLLLDNFECLLTAYENRDYILCADYMEKGIVDVLKKAIPEWMPEWSGFPDYEEYRLEYTEIVSATVAKKIENQWRYLHSNCDPWQEAFLWAERQMEAGIEKYYIAGLGLGHHAYFLAENPLVHVVVFEEDRKIIELYQHNIGNPGKNMELVYDPGYIKFRDVSCSIDKKREKLCLYYPSIQTIKDVELKQKMKRLFLQIDNAKFWKKYILYQKGFDMAECYAKEKKYQMVETGGSVVTTALYLCIARAQKDSCKIEFVDATEGGARIQGIKICKL